MSLEEALNRNSDLMEKLVAQNEKILNIAASRQAAGGSEAAEKPAKGKATKDKAKDDDAGDKKLSKSDLTGALSAWLNEFGKPGEHPESSARHGALKKVLEQLKLENLKALTDDDQTNIDKIHNWLETKAKTADKGFGIGRLAADPEPAKEESGEDDLGV